MASEILSRLTRKWDCSRYAERYCENDIRNKKKSKRSVGQHDERTLVVTMIGALHTATRMTQMAMRLGLCESAYLMSTLWTGLQTLL